MTSPTASKRHSLSTLLILGFILLPQALARTVPPSAATYVPEMMDAVHNVLKPAAATSTTAPPPPPPPPPPPAFAPGTCAFHIKEKQDCDPDSDNLLAVVNLKDGKGNDIGDTGDADDTAGDAYKLIGGDFINDGHPYIFKSKLPNPLVITGEHENDYIQFVYGSLAWKSNEPNGGATCNVGGWDPKNIDDLDCSDAADSDGDGPVDGGSDDGGSDDGGGSKRRSVVKRNSRKRDDGGHTTDTNYSTRDMDCFFPC